MSDLPRLLITMGDVAGVGPEIIARAWPDLLSVCRPVVVGDPRWLELGLQLIGSAAKVVPVAQPSDEQPEPESIPCLVVTKQKLAAAAPGVVSAEAGQAAYDF